ncbi:hypothetical protein BaRGS_00032871 [Batillaria attramentaria]|uniref:Uncharacterized protein n=1 Tax=Batillaria attramentaria TaxID=370345 RepID=A0ABD0JMF1_9CAEN
MFEGSPDAQWKIRTHNALRPGSDGRSSVSRPAVNLQRNLFPDAFYPDTLVSLSTRKGLLYTSLVYLRLHRHNERRVFEIFDFEGESDCACSPVCSYDAFSAPVPSARLPPKAFVARLSQELGKWNRIKSHKRSGKASCASVSEVSKVQVYIHVLILLSTFKSVIVKGQLLSKPDRFGVCTPLRCTGMMKGSQYY